MRNRYKLTNCKKNCSSNNSAERVKLCLDTLFKLEKV